MCLIGLTRGINALRQRNIGTQLWAWDSEALIRGLLHSDLGKFSATNGIHMHQYPECRHWGRELEQYWRKGCVCVLWLVPQVLSGIWPWMLKFHVFTVGLSFWNKSNQNLLFLFDTAIKVESWTPNCSRGPELNWSHNSLVSILVLNALHQLITAWHSIKFNHWTPKHCNVSTYSMVPFGWKFSISFKDY